MEVLIVLGILAFIIVGAGAVIVIGTVGKEVLDANAHPPSEIRRFEVDKTHLCASSNCTITWTWSAVNIYPDTRIEIYSTGSDNTLGLFDGVADQWPSHGERFYDEEERALTYVQSITAYDPALFAEPGSYGLWVRLSGNVGNNFWGRIWGTSPKLNDVRYVYLLSEETSIPARCEASSKLEVQPDDRMKHEYKQVFGANLTNEKLWSETPIRIQCKGTMIKAFTVSSLEVHMLEKHEIDYIKKSNGQYMSEEDNPYADHDPSNIFVKVQHDSGQELTVGPLSEGESHVFDNPINLGQPVVWLIERASGAIPFYPNRRTVCILSVLITCPP